MNAVLFSLAATIAGTFLGSLIAVWAGNRSPKFIAYLLAFAAGVMMALVFLDIIPEVMEIVSVPVTISGIGAGILIILLFDTVSDKMLDGNGLKAARAQEKNKILRSGYIMLLSVGIHNFPAGLAIGAGAKHDLGFAGTIALALALHNIPEGIATAALLLAGRAKKRTVLLLTTLTGVPTVLGAGAGYFVGNISDTATALTTSAVAGIILYMIFEEILPQGTAVSKTRATVCTLLGIIAGTAALGG